MIRKILLITPFLLYQTKKALNYKKVQDLQRINLMLNSIKTNRLLKMLKLYNLKLNKTNFFDFLMKVLAKYTLNLIIYYSDINAD
jgi:hypothetical protein